MTALALFRAALARLRVQMAFASIVARYRRQGHALPAAIAMKEVQFRGLLEEFRDFASDAMIAEQPTLDDIRRRWIEERLRPMAEFMPSADVAILRNVIRDMPVREMLHPEALRVWEKSCGEAGVVLLTAHQARALGG